MINNPINRWWTVFGGALACAVGIGVLGNSFGIFTKAIAAEFGWDRSTATMGLTIQHICSGLSYIPLGAIMLRWGMRRPTAVLTALCAVAIISLGFVPNSPALYYALFTVVGFSSAAATAMPYSVAITRWFDNSRGLALGVMVTGTGVGASLVPILTNFLLTNYGWRVGFMVLGALMATGALFALTFMVRTPPAPVQPAPGAAGDGEPAPSVVAIFTRLPHFWTIALPVFFLSIAVGGIIVNIVPIMTDKGFSEVSAVGMLSVAGFASWGSRILVGALMDRIFAPFVAAAVMLLCIVGVLLILLAPVWLPAAYFCAVCIGFSLGAEADIVTFLVSRYFRPAIYSKIVGAVWLFFGWGFAAGISIASYSHGFLGAYAPALQLFAGLALVSAVVVLRLPAYPFPNREKQQAAAGGIPAGTGPLAGARE